MLISVHKFIKNHLIFNFLFVRLLRYRVEQLRHELFDVAPITMLLRFLLLKLRDNLIECIVTNLFLLLQIVLLEDIRMLVRCPVVDICWRCQTRSLPIAALLRLAPILFQIDFFTTNERDQSKSFLLLCEVCTQICGFVVSSRCLGTTFTLDTTQ